MNNKYNIIFVFGAARLHPLTRCHRLILLLCSVCLSVLSPAIERQSLLITLNAIFYSKVFDREPSRRVNMKQSSLCSCFESMRISFYIQTFSAICYLVTAIAILASCDRIFGWFGFFRVSVGTLLKSIWICFHRRYVTVLISGCLRKENGHREMQIDIELLQVFLTSQRL